MANSIIGHFVGSLIDGLRLADPDGLSNITEKLGADVVAEIFRSQSAIGGILGEADVTKIDSCHAAQLGWINSALAEIGHAVMHNEPGVLRVVR